MPYLGSTPNASFSSRTKQDFTANGSTTAFTLSSAVASANDIEVFVGNVRQEPTEAYTVNGVTLTMSAAPANGINFYVVFKGLEENSVVPADGSISSAKIASGAVSSSKLDTNIAISGNLTVDTNTLKVDSTNNRVGIGTDSPNATLTVSQGANNIFAVERTGVSGGSGQFGVNIESNSQATVSYDDGAPLVFGTASSPSTHVGFTERMKISADGHVTKPSQPFFEVHTVPNNHANGQVVDFTGITSNVGSHWNNATNRFTAPTAGVYQFNFSVFTHRTTNTGDYYWDLRNNGAVIYRAYDAKDSSQNRHCQVTGSHAMYLSANDYVDLHFAVGPDSMEASGNHNRFSGYLVG